VVIWANFVITITQMLQMVLQLYFWVVIIAAIMSWIEPNPYNPIVRAIYSLTEPVFDWVRRHMPVMFGGIDFSPMVVIFAIYFLQAFFIPTVRQLALGGFN
jgi:YggT family protein